MTIRGIPEMISGLLRELTRPHWRESSYSGKRPH